MRKGDLLLRHIQLKVREDLFIAHKILVKTNNEQHENSTIISCPPRTMIQRIIHQLLLFVIDNSKQKTKKKAGQAFQILAT
jgi:hypothetical protein